MRRNKRKPNKVKKNQKDNKEGNRAVEVKLKPPDQNLQNQKIKQIKRQSRRREEKIGLTIKDVKLLDRLYSKGPASFGNSKRLQDLSRLPMTFRNMIKHKQPQKVWVDDGTEFLGAFETLCNKRGNHLYSTFSEKKSAFAERKFRSLKKIFYRYLETKWTYLYINNLDQFVKNINSRVKRITKLAPNKVTKKDVPRLVSLTVETRHSQKPKLYVGDFV